MIDYLKDLESVSGGGKILDCTDKSVSYEDGNVFVEHDEDLLVFKMMTKPASEGGKGCQVTDLVEVALHAIKNLNAKFPCDENVMTIHYLQRALSAQKERTENRVKRNVEGKNEA